MVLEPNIRPVVLINSSLAQEDKSVNYDTFFICNSLSSKFFHFYLSFVNFQYHLSSCRCVQLCKMPQTCTVQCSWYLRQKEPANPQSFLTSASSLISELPPSSIAHLPHPPRSLFPLSELFLSPPTLQHPLFPNRSTYPLAHPCTTLSPPPLHPLPPAAPRKSLCPSIPTRISFLKTGKSSSFGYWGWRVGSSRGILDASRQGAKDTGCRTAEDSRARGHEGQAHQKPHP